MADLNVMMREHAKAGLQAQMDKAVADGDTAAALKVADEIATLAVNTAPKAPPFGDIEIRAELDKQAWFGTDPKRSAKAVEFGKTMDPKKFATAEAFAAAIVKAVDEEFKPPAAEPGEGDDDGNEDDNKPPAGEKKPRQTDGPGEGEANNRARAGRSSGPWKKLSDAPLDVQKEINRTADKFVSASAPNELREKFVNNALGSHYAAHQQKAGKK